MQGQHFDLDLLRSLGALSNGYTNDLRSSETQVEINPTYDSNQSQSQTGDG